MLSLTAVSSTMEGSHHAGLTLNAANQMFAEDSARRMRRAVTDLGLFNGTAAEAVHLERSHPHDAVAKVASGPLVNAAWR